MCLTKCALKINILDERPTYQIINKKDKQTVSVLYNRYGRKLYGFAIHSWNIDEDNTWELVYQTLYKVLETYENYSFESEKKFGSFIFKIFVNYLRNHYRDTKKREEHLNISSFNELNFEESYENGAMHTEREVRKKIVEQSENEQKEEPLTESENLKLLKEELAKLEDWQRVLLLLRSQNMPYSEIAIHIGKPESQLKVYYQRLKNRLYKNLNPLIEDSQKKTRQRT